MKKYLPIFWLSMLFVSCNPSQTALNDLQKFTERIEQKSSGWSEAEWDDALMYYSEICETIERNEYSDQEIREIGKLKGRCIAQFAKHSLHEGTRDMHDVFIELGGAIEGLLDGLNIH